MQTIQDIIALAKNASEYAPSGKKSFIKPRMRSISSFSESSMYYFPTLASSNLNPKSLKTVLGFLEGHYANFVTATFSLMPAMVISSKDEINVANYLKQFHQNFGVEGGSIGGTEVDFTNVDKMTKLLGESGLDLNKDWEMTASVVLNEASGDTDEPKNVIAYSNAEYKKAEAGMPHIVKTSIKFILKGTDNVIDITIPVGVKCKLHVLPGDDLVDRTSSVVSGKGFVHDVIRYTTGENLSLKDLIFGVSRIKKDVTSQNDDVAQWFSALERRKRLANASIPFLNKQTFLPNSTIVLTLNEVENLKQTMGIDLMNPRVYLRLMKNTFLLGFVIVDELGETVYSVFDGFYDMEQVPFSVLKRDNDKKDNETAQLLKALASMR